jgi:hypothetical protein
MQDFLPLETIAARPLKHFWPTEKKNCCRQRLAFVDGHIT